MRAESKITELSARIAGLSMLSVKIMMRENITEISFRTI